MYIPFKTYELHFGKYIDLYYVKKFVSSRSNFQFIGGSGPLNGFDCG